MEEYYWKEDELTNHYVVRDFTIRVGSRANDPDAFDTSDDYSSPSDSDYIILDYSDIDSDWFFFFVIFNWLCGLISNYYDLINIKLKNFTLKCWRGVIGCNGCNTEFLMSGESQCNNIIDLLSRDFSHNEYH